MSNKKGCFFCVHANVNRRNGDLGRCMKKHRYVDENSACEDYQDKSLEKITELFFKEKEK